MSYWGRSFLNLSLSAASRLLLLRDAALGVTRRLRRHEAAEAFSFRSEDRNLSAIYVPAERGMPSLLLCHGIGETVEHWSATQALLRDHGVGSLVFNYSGYGRSSGRVRVENCDADFLAAYAELRRRAGSGAKIFVLGFSLGSGIAAANVAKLEPPPSGLFLCEAFDSFHAAAEAAGVPRWLIRSVPDVWNTAAVVPTLQMPVYVMHSTHDRLFPVSMAEKIVAASGVAELVVVEGFAHNEPFLRAAGRYWQEILMRVQ